jgi:tRNA threonylcarbamoyladenosine biosynthesis protein TsaB
MAWILSIETASFNCSVSVFEGNTLISFREDPSPEYTHGELLHVFIDETLKEANIQPNQLSAVAVSKGPGSYTGLRIGVSAAKGVCFALGIPLISIPTLLVLGKALSNPEGILIPMLDARRMEVYSAVYDANLNSIRETRAEILNEDSFSDYLQSKVVHLLGSGASKCQELLKHPNFHFHPELLPSSLNMGVLAFEAFNEERFEDLAYFEPYYLKDFIATQKIIRD